MNRTFNLADLFEIVAAAVPERSAFVCGESRLSFAELDLRATRLGAALRQRGVRRGDNVGIALHNCAAYLETFFACCKIGAVPVNVNYRYLAGELGYLVRTLALKTLVFGADSGAEIDKLAAQTGGVDLYVRLGGAGGPPASVDYQQLLGSGAATLSDPLRSGDDHYILCTGGTTGMPKGVVWTHTALLMAALGGGGIFFRRPPIEVPEQLAGLVASGPALSYFAAAPMMHGAAMWASLISLLAGHAVVANDQQHFDPEHVWDMIERHRVSIISIVGDAMALPLIQALEAHPGRWDLSCVLVFGNGGAQFSHHLQERVKACLPQVTINNGMGSSESGNIGGSAQAVKGEGMIRIGARPDLALIDDDGQVVDGPGSVGTLARSGHIPIGYYGDPERTAQLLVTIDGRRWLLTGDRARIDEEGDIIVLGRGSQCINTGGEKVFPEEVENAARRYAAVSDVVVVGIADPRWGQKVAAVVQAGPGFSAAQLEQVCRAHLASYKIPRAVFLAERIERTPAGKPDYQWLNDFISRASSIA